MKKNNFKTIISVIIGVFVLFFAIIFMSSGQSKTEKAFLEEHNLDGLSVKQIVAKLEHETNEDSNLYAAITGTKLTLGDVKMNSILISQVITFMKGVV